MLQLKVNPQDVTLRAFQYAAGDVNMDQQVSPDDINLILQGPQVRRRPLGRHVAQGDVDNDQDVDPDDILDPPRRRLDAGPYGETPITATNATTSTVSANRMITSRFPSIAAEEAAGEEVAGAAAPRERGRLHDDRSERGCPSLRSVAHYTARVGENCYEQGSSRELTKPARN